MQVNSHPSVASVFQFVEEASRLVHSKLDVIDARFYNPMPISVLLFRTATSGYLFLCAVKRDFVCNGSSADCVDESSFSSGCCTRKWRITELLKDKILATKQIAYIVL